VRSAYRVGAIACGALASLFWVVSGDEVLFLSGAVKLHGEVRQVMQTGNQWAYSIAVEGPAVVSRVECFYRGAGRSLNRRPRYQVGDGVDVLYNAERGTRFWSPPALLVFIVVLAGAGTWGTVGLWREGSRNPRPQVPGPRPGRLLLDLALVLGTGAAVASVIAVLMWLVLFR
jgi:hypothetical protein